MELSQLFDGNDNRALVAATTDALRGKRCTLDQFAPAAQSNEVERTVFAVWESCAMISSGGFLYLIENDADLSYCADCYDRIGMIDAGNVFRNVSKLLPDQYKNRRYDEIGENFADWSEDESVYNQFRTLDRRYYDLTNGDALANILGQYIRENREQMLR